MQLTFHRLSERMPADGQEVWCIASSTVSGTHQFKYVIVEMTWVEMKDGYSTGMSYIYEEGVEAPPDCVLVSNLPNSALWCPVDDVWRMIDLAREQEQIAREKNERKEGEACKNETNS